MFNSTLEIIIKARDEASQVMSGLNSKLKTMEPTFKKMAVGGTAAFAALGAGIASCLGEATEARKGISQLDAVLQSTKGAAGVTKDSVLALADSLSKTSLFTDDAILGAQNLLLTFTSIGKDVFPQATQTILDMSQSLGQDLKSSTVQLGKALQDPINGITALSRVGVNFTQSQKDMITSLVKSGKTMEAQKIIMKELNTEFGNSAAAAAKADPFSNFKKSMGEVQESLGTALLPLLDKFVSILQPIVDKMGQWVSDNPQLAAAIIGVAVALTGLITVVGGLGLVLPSIIAGFTAIGAAVTFLTGSTITLGAVMTFLTGPIALVLAAIALLVVATIAIMKNWDKIKVFFVTLWAEVKKNFKESIDDIISFFQPLIDTIDMIIRMIQRISSGLASVGKAVGGKISSLFGGGKATGGNVSGNKSYLVGEQGPEIFTPGGSGFITPNKQIGGGQSVVVNINGGNYLSQDAALQMGDHIIRALQTQMRGA